MDKNTSFHPGWIPSCGSGLSLGASPRLPATSPRSGRHRPPLPGLGRWSWWSYRSGLQAARPRIPLRLSARLRTRTRWPAAAIPSRGTAGPSGRGGAGRGGAGRGGGGFHCRWPRSPGPWPERAPRRAAHARAPATTTGSTAERPPRAHRPGPPGPLRPAAPLPPPSAPAATRPHKSPRDRRRRRPEVPGPRRSSPRTQVGSCGPDPCSGRRGPGAPVTFRGSPHVAPCVPWILSAWPAPRGGRDRDVGDTPRPPPPPPPLLSRRPLAAETSPEPRAPSPEPRQPERPAPPPSGLGLHSPAERLGSGCCLGSRGRGGPARGAQSAAPRPPPRHRHPATGPATRVGLRPPPRGRYGGGGWGLGAGSWPGALEQLQPALGPPGMRERAAHQDFYGNLLLEAAAAAAAAARGLPAAGAAAARAHRAPGPPRAPRTSRTSPSTRTPAHTRAQDAHGPSGRHEDARRSPGPGGGRGPRRAGRGLRGEARSPDPASAVCPRLGRGAGAALRARAPSLGDFCGGAPHPEPRGSSARGPGGPQVWVPSARPACRAVLPGRPAGAAPAPPEAVLSRAGVSGSGARTAAQDLVPCIAEPQRNCVATSPRCGVCHPIRRQIVAPWATF
ncbi:unnamed protein product [Nyctereutes procyonoides]|uniref:(raccoon dog) hypothetical protein n=1 Tax=Nyctereutes procyonoides TaxID=34880 RepID=A0A811Z074_NYCPR|nr:unnamed protein product [Nyctereutes procyonoides]